MIRSEDDAVSASVRRELDAMGFEVIETQAEGELGELAEAHAAGAVIDVPRNGREVQVWTAGERGEGVVDVIVARGDEGEEGLAVGVGEALRARGMQERSTTTTQSPTAPAVAATPTTTNATTPANPIATASPATPVVERPAALLWAEAGPALTLSPGGLGAEASAHVQARVQPVSLLSISGFGFVPLGRADVLAQEGRASASTWLLGVALDAHLDAAPFELAAGLGIASAIVVMQGEGEGAFEGREEIERTAAPLARASAHFDLGGLRLVLRAHAAVSVPRVEMRFDQREVAHWGQPFVAISLGIELPLIDR